MWNTQSPWFDVAWVMTVFAVGNVLFGRFEEHKPRSLRLLKLLIVLAVVLLLSWLGQRWIAYALVGLVGLAALYIHAIWLPRHGINGWTGEPRERYLELVGATRSGTASARAPPTDVPVGSPRRERLPPPWTPPHATPTQATRAPRWTCLDRALGCFLVALGCVHNFVAAPLAFDEWSTRALWFVSAGLALWYAGFLNLVRAADAPGSAAQHFSRWANVSLLAFVLAFAATSGRGAAPESILLVAAVAALTVLSFVPRVARGDDRS